METSLSDDVDILNQTGLVHISSPFDTLDDAWHAAENLVAACTAFDDDIEVVGDFVVPPLDGPASREFQTLHFDFGLPLAPVVTGDVARFTALHLLATEPSGAAFTRLAPLRPLLAARRWPDRTELIRRFADYGASHGAWDDAAGYVEGSLARIIEAAAGHTPVLPSVKTQPGFLCGTEFASLTDEQRFLAGHGLHPETVAVEVCLRPGELLVFDNLAVAHGRRGRRRPGELHQHMLGHRSAAIDHQRKLRDHVLAAFAS